MKYENCPNGIAVIIIITWYKIKILNTLKIKSKILLSINFNKKVVIISEA